ncbi:carboxypeptidase-like regulatory domain-containing protein [Leptobacterium flavescens]|uniref:Carboxypeptidase-like regulatory domain-containing protein n=1 Tax=Leptobacterium flavescens TaxID=472055 RepID=A0A6P0UNQ1_9FLAO|nr:carboxypeptidase-like regulatory domain-containing protein [Leptobacterium flavescens]NER11956.1 carboxypeptidase-like regulatory domain-containing protein [Leptobacterium flavescens]
MKKVVFLITLLFISLGYSQENQQQETEVNGIVVNAENDFPLSNVHIVNLNKVIGTISDANGEFQIRASVNDTLYFSFIGFKSIKVRVTNDIIKFQGTRIGLTELAYALEEVVVRPYRLTGYLEIDAKNIPVNNAYRYSISGLQRGYEAGRPDKVSKVLNAIFDPATTLNNIFGKKPKQLRKLRKMKEDDEIRNLLASKFDRETLSALIQVDKADIEDILRNCNYSKDFIRTANDLQILDAISGCYEEYRVLNREN